jgi:hypothetical protein
MILRALCVAIMIFAGSFPGGGAPSGRLEGCPDTSVTAEALARLQQVDWTAVSIAKLRATWPTNLGGLDCDVEGCTSLWHKGRIISEHCECCETFYFEVDGGKGKPRREQLDALVINYSAPSRDDVVAVAKDFATAVGVPVAKLESIGREQSNEFSWDGRLPGGLSLVSVKLLPLKNLWTLYFYLSHDPQRAPDSEPARRDDGGFR